MTKERRKSWLKAAIVIGVIVGAEVILVVTGVWGRLTTQLFGQKTVEVTEQVAVDEEAYGYVEAETVANLVTKFNQAVNAQAGWDLLPVDEATMMVYEEKYWYPLDGEVALVVVPVEFGNNKDKDIAATGVIYMEENSANREKAEKYWRCLVRANDGKLSDEEVEGLVAEAEKAREREETANRGGGIFVAVNGAEGHVEYQVTRNYRK